MSSLMCEGVEGVVRVVLFLLVRGVRGHGVASGRNAWVDEGRPVSVRAAALRDGVGGKRADARL